jgi:Adenosylmethionine-8-amino-7-oxononanoate aminotransferase
MFGFQHWNLEPDIITLAKTLSGGYVPCGAIVTRAKFIRRRSAAWIAALCTPQPSVATISQWRVGWHRWK